MTPSSGGAGNDTLYGGAGVDTYRFARGDGADTISTAGTTGEDILAFGPGIAPDDLVFTKGSDTAMVLKIKGTTDQITFGQWATSDSYKVSRMTFDGGPEWTLADIKNRFITINGTEAIDTLTGLAGSRNAIAGLGRQRHPERPGTGRRPRRRRRQRYPLWPGRQRHPDRQRRNRQALRRRRQ